MNTQNATPAASPEDQRIEAVMELADDYAKSAAEYQYDSTGLTEMLRGAARNALRAAIASQLAATQVASPLTDVLILNLTTGLFPRFREDIQERFVLEVARAVEAAHGITAPTSQQPTQEGV